MVASKVRLQPKRVQYINTAMTSVPELCERLADAIQESLSDCPTGCAVERWNDIRDATYKSAADTFGKTERKNPDGFEVGIEELEPAISSKRDALLN